MKKSPQKPAAKNSKVIAPWKIGQSYLFRTVTMTWTGRLIGIFPQELVIEDAAWIADTGRFNEVFLTGSANEVEPVQGPVVIGRAAIIDAISWNLPLPRSVK